MRLRLPRALGSLLQPAAAARSASLSAGFALAVLLALGPAGQAGATTIGTVVSSVGLFAALAALPLVRDLPLQMLPAALPTAGLVLLIGAGATWWWRGRTTQPPATVLAPAGRTARAAAEPPRECPGAAMPPSPSRPPSAPDSAALVDELRLHFMRLQSAWDLDDMPRLRALTTPGMLDELCSSRLASTRIGNATPTEVLALEAELLDCRELAGTFVVSVDFSGLMRESGTRNAVPFRELWMLVKFNSNETGWKLARQQALL